MKLKAVMSGTIVMEDSHNSVHVQVVEKWESVVQPIRKAGLACGSQVKLQLRMGDSLLYYLNLFQS